ncbi:trimethylamine methyltransferase family protein [Candidatus Latescibacterota bacterium]
MPEPLLRTILRTHTSYLLMMAFLRTHLILELLDESQLASLLEHAITVWRRVSFRVQGTDEFFDHLSAYGCRIDGEHVHFPNAVIERVLHRIGVEKTARQSRPPDSGDESPRSGEITTFTHGQALSICDLETNDLRPATVQDLAAWCRAVDALSIPARSHPTFIPTDVPRGAADFHTFATIILNSGRPYRVSVYSARNLPLFIRACAIAKGSEAAVREDPIFAAKCWANSPFMLTRENVDIAMETRRLLGQPFTPGHMPVAGAAGPITVAGSLVQNTAESLALCAMRLALDDLTCGVSGSSAVLDMRAGAPRQSGPDVMLHLLAGSQMNSYLFGGRPSLSLSGVAAPVVSAQSQSEKAMAMAWNVAAGQRALGVGSLAYSDVGSPVQLILDLEQARYFQELVREVVVDEEHIGLDTILATIGQGARYLEGEHTARHFREESWLSELLDYRVAHAWGQSGGDLIDRARERARQVWAEAQNQCPLSDSQRQEIEDLQREADGLAGEETRR